MLLSVWQPTGWQPWACVAASSPQQHRQHVFNGLQREGGSPVQQRLSLLTVCLYLHRGVGLTARTCRCLIVFVLIHTLPGCGVSRKEKKRAD